MGKKDKGEMGRKSRGKERREGRRGKYERGKGCMRHGCWWDGRPCLQSV